jgi:hypothetical protein
MATRSITHKIISFLSLFIFGICTLHGQEVPQDSIIPAGVQGAPNPMQMNYEQLVGQALIDDAFPNSIPLFGSKVRIKFGGYAKLDYIQDFNYIGSQWEFESATIPVEGTPEAALKGRSTLHAKESRFNFDLRTVVENEKYGWKFPLQVFIEFDFFEDNPDLFRQPRLRQAYGVIGRILAGQTWSINADLEALPGIIDFGGGDGTYGDRVAQIRWQDDIGNGFRYAVGIEEPKSSIANPDTLEGQARPTMPTFAGRLRWNFWNGSHLQIGADLFQHHWQGGETGPTFKRIGFGVNFTGRIIFDKNNKNTLVFGASTGSGVAHRILLLEFEPNDAVVGQNELELLTAGQGYVGFNHYWTKDFNSTIAAYWAHLNPSNRQADLNTRNGGTFHVNFVWFPYKYVSTGVEYIRGLHRVKDGREGTANRLQFMIRFRIP